MPLRLVEKECVRLYGLLQGKELWPKDVVDVEGGV
jgi:hypothetical protein